MAAIDGVMALNHILLSGAGQLGSRYLQGLVSVGRPLSITVVDPSKSALARAQARWLEVGGCVTSHQVAWYESLPGDFDGADLAIISTSADCRSSVVADISNRGSIRYWVLEKVLAQSVGELEQLKVATGSSGGCWVNTPRRMMSWHRQIRSLIPPCAPLQVRNRGGLWGLACNSIHFIDLVAWWTGERLVRVDTAGLNHNWFESKRPGFYEITGVLTATFSGGTTLHLESHPDAEEQGIFINTPASNWHIDETTGVCIGADGHRVNGQIEYQSTMTTRLVTSILQEGHCELPTLAESADQHAVLLDAMLAHWNRTHHRNDDRLLIT